MHASKIPGIILLRRQLGLGDEDSVKCRQFKEIFEKFRLSYTSSSGRAGHELYLWNPATRREIKLMVEAFLEKDNNGAVFWPDRLPNQNSFAPQLKQDRPIIRKNLTYLIFQRNKHTRNKRTKSRSATIKRQTVPTEPSADRGDLRPGMTRPPFEGQSRSNSDGESSQCAGLGATNSQDNRSAASKSTTGARSAEFAEVNKRTRTSEGRVLETGQEGLDQRVYSVPASPSTAGYGRPDHQETPSKRQKLRAPSNQDFEIDDTRVLQDEGLEVRRCSGRPTTKPNNADHLSHEQVEELRDAFGGPRTSTPAKSKRQTRRVPVGPARRRNVATNISQIDTSNSTIPSVGLETDSVDDNGPSSILKSSEDAEISIANGSTTNEISQAINDNPSVLSPDRLTDTLEASRPVSTGGLSATADLKVTYLVKFRGSMTEYLPWQPRSGRFQYETLEEVIPDLPEETCRDRIIGLIFRFGMDQDDDDDFYKFSILRSDEGIFRVMKKRVRQLIKESLKQPSTRFLCLEMEIEPIYGNEEGTSKANRADENLDNILEW